MVFHPTSSIFFSPFFLFTSTFLVSKYCPPIILMILFLILLSIIAVQSPRPPIRYPVRFTYVNAISWTSMTEKLRTMGVPGYCQTNGYNYVAFTFWTSAGPLDVAKLWDDPVRYLGTSPELGNTKDQIQKSIKKKFNDKNISLLVSAFGSTDKPTSKNPVNIAKSLGAWVRSNNLDGVDIDYEDNRAMAISTGQDWVIKFQRQLRIQLPNHIITHAPQAPYFSTSYYRKGGYVTIHKQVGDGIDFYNVQFYNQGTSQYNTYGSLFVKSIGWSVGTSVSEIKSFGVPYSKIIVGKPGSRIDAFNTGLVSATDLGNWAVQAYNNLGWFGGIMVWQFRSDINGTYINTTINKLKTGYENRKKSEGLLKEQLNLNQP